MNISRLGSSGGPIIGAAGQTTKGAKIGVHAASEAEKAPKTPDAPAIDVSNVPAGTRPRIAKFMQAVDKRLEHVMSEKGISHRQLEALKDAQQKFHGMMNRLNEALANPQDKEGFGGAAVENVLGALSGSLNAILEGPQKTDPEMKRIDKMA